LVLRGSLNGHQKRGVFTCTYGLGKRRKTMHKVSNKVWDYDAIDRQRNKDWNGIHKLVTDHAVEKRVTADEIAKRNAIFYNHKEINKP
jgi:hypothetical protein